MSERPRASLQWLSVVALATIACVWAALPTAAHAGASEGKQIFDQKCSACHTIGNGALVGPDLKGVTERRPRAWLEEWIAGPSAVLAKNDPYATSLLHKFHDVQMPDLGLSASDIDSVLAYLGGGAATAAPAKSEPALKGNAEAGKDLFTGVVPFANGGPPCMACHSVGGIGALGGGRLGPDLTEVVHRFGGAAAVNAFIAGTPTPTMNAVWSKRRLTPQERANIVALLTQAEVSRRPAGAVWQLGFLAALGCIILLALGAWRWDYRLRFGTRIPMVAKPTTGHTDPRKGGWFTGTYPDGWKGRYPASNAEARSPATAPRRHS